MLTGMLPNTFPENPGLGAGVVGMKHGNKHGQMDKWINVRLWEFEEFQTEMASFLM